MLVNSKNNTRQTPQTTINSIVSLDGVPLEDY